MIDLNIIPKAQKVTNYDRNTFKFTLAKCDLIVHKVDSNLKDIIDVTPTPKVGDSSTLELEIDKNIKITEKYILKIDNHNIKISASSEQGLKNGLNTLCQILVFNNSYLCDLEIEDYPAFAWRGIHLDVSRHFFTVREIMKLLHLLAQFKINKFHWHLSDDQGWRIESKKYPRLHEIGSKRIEPDGTISQHYYSQIEVKYVVARAKLLGIEVIPEIDIPGHTKAIITAYPELSCSKKKTTVEPKWGVFEEVLCVSNPVTREFIENLLGEMAVLFPSKYFHIGGDECPTTAWENCPQCQEYYRNKKFTSYSQMQGDFNHFVSNVLAQFDKIIIGWDEIGDSDIPDNSILMCWRGSAVDAAKVAINNNLQFILTPQTVTYLDWKPSDEPNEMGAFGVSDLKNIYNYNPHQFNSDLLLGIQGNIWTEHIENWSKLCYMTFPRAMALAEIAWCDSSEKNYEEFLKRVKKLLEYYSTLKINYCKNGLD